MIFGIDSKVVGRMDGPHSTHGRGKVEDRVNSFNSLCTEGGIAYVAHNKFSAYITGKGGSWGDVCNAYSVPELMQSARGMGSLHYCISVPLSHQ